ncbi:MAG: GNAT family N-acetyltransferase, partial [Chitinophagales bacterium]
SHILQTKRFELRAPKLQDASRIFSATRYEGFNDGMLWESPEKEEEIIEPINKSLQAWESGEGYSFTVVAKNSTELLGRISIRKTAKEQVWDVGFWTHPASQRQGVMTEALAGVLKFGFEELSATKIEACHAVWNKASEKVLQRNGFEFVEYIEKGFQKRGKWIDENKLVIDREAWKKSAYL